MQKVSDFPLPPLPILTLQSTQTSSHTKTHSNKTMVAFTPALAYVAGSGGNFVSCIALPRKTVQSIYIQVRSVSPKKGKNNNAFGKEIFFQKVPS